jgi:3-hydroxyisobutyrate dehydrogenase-like beta-hydroxyacid dehydrogenase
MPRFESMRCLSVCFVVSHNELDLFHGDRLGVTTTTTSSTTRTSIIMSASIGFVGLGIMGEGMAARLISEGIAGTEETPLVVWNRTGAKCTALVDKFPDKNIVTKDTAKEVVEACGVTYSMLSTPEASKIVFESESGVLAGVSAGKSIIDCATLAETDMQRMSDAVVAKGG